MKEFPDMKAEVLDESNLRSQYARKQGATYSAIINKEAKLVIRKFNEVAHQQNYEVQEQQRVQATQRKDVQYRRSIEFIYKDKRLRNAIPPQESADGSGVKHFVSANPKLTKIMEKVEKKRKKASQHQNDMAINGQVAKPIEETNFVSKMLSYNRNKRRASEMPNNEDPSKDIKSSKDGTYVSGERRRAI